jgi:RNA polymerase sigma factor (sigma-70 family)
MVLATCRAGTGDLHAADDCFQAVFLVLVRKGRRLGVRSPLGPWLFGVARRVCSRARAAAARRAKHEAHATRAAVAPPDAGLSPDVAALVHAEVGRLPRSLRSVVVLCDLAGLSYHEAADRLGVTHAAVRGRLARGRDRLRRRLGLRGVRPDVIWVVPVAVPAALAAATADAAEVVAGRTAGVVAAPVLELVTGGLRIMVMTKLKAAGLSALSAGVVVAGAMGLSAQNPTPIPTPGPEPTPQRAPASDYAPRVRAASRTAAAEAVDPGDKVADLVRRAQRLQDRGEVAAAREAVAQAGDALKQWADHLDKQAAPPGFEDRPVRTRTAPPLNAVFSRSPVVTTDVDARLREVEAKLDRVLREMAKDRAADKHR